MRSHLVLRTIQTARLKNIKTPVTVTFEMRPGVPHRRKHRQREPRRLPL